jgi:arsenate reductase-like glutaredoxin family protein
MATTLYGIKNCDTIKKARKWLDELASITAFTITAPTV